MVWLRLRNALAVWEVLRTALAIAPRNLWGKEWSYNSCNVHFLQSLIGHCNCSSKGTKWGTQSSCTPQKPGNHPNFERKEDNLKMLLEWKSHYWSNSRNSGVFSEQLLELHSRCENKFSERLLEFSVPTAHKSQVHHLPSSQCQPTRPL